MLFENVIKDKSNVYKDFLNEFDEIDFVCMIIRFMLEKFFFSYFYWEIDVDICVL